MVTRFARRAWVERPHFCDGRRGASLRRHNPALRSVVHVSLAPPKPSPLVPGYQLDRYELLCPIAEGGMAQVWIARMRGKHGFEKLVAIKSILPRYASDSHFQQ